MPREMYEEVKIIAKDEGRTISGQLKMIFEGYKEAKTENETGGQGSYTPETYSK